MNAEIYEFDTSGVADAYFDLIDGGADEIAASHAIEDRICRELRSHREGSGAYDEIESLLFWFQDLEEWELDEMGEDR